MAQTNHNFALQLRRWNPVLADVRRWRQSSAALRHLEMTVTARPPVGAATGGQVLWGTVVDQALVGVAWRWARLKNGAVVLADPMTVATNLALVDDGRPLSATALACCLNSIIFDLPWQQRILAELE